MTLGLDETFGLGDLVLAWSCCPCGLSSVFLFEAHGEASGWFREMGGGGRPLLPPSTRRTDGSAESPPGRGHAPGLPSGPCALGGLDNRKVVIDEKFPSKFAGVGNKAYLCTRISEEGRLAQLV